MADEADGSVLGLSNWQRLILGVLLSLLSGVLLTLSFAPHNLWPLVWVSLVPMIVAQFRVMPRRWTSLAPALTIGGWLGTYLGPIFAGSGTYMIWLPLVIGAINLLAEKGTRGFHDRSGYRWFVLYGVVNWVGIELVRSLIPLMGTWAFIAYTLYDLPWLIQPVSIFGIFGMSVVILSLNFAIGKAVLAAFDQRWRWDSDQVIIERQPARRWLIGSAALLLGWAALSLLLLRPASGPAMRVAAVHVPGRNAQGGYEQNRAAIIADLEALTRQAAAAGAQLVVWPEGALNFDPQSENADWLPALAHETGTTMVAGYLAQGGEDWWRNELVVVSPGEGYLGIYGKDHPVVFGGERNTSLGTYPVYDLAAAKLGTIICYDLDFTDTARKITRNGAQIIAVPSLDWPAIAGRHYVHLVFRAVENRVAMVKADGGYDSAVIDAYGRIVDLLITPQGASGVLIADVPPGSASAPAVLLGDWIGWLSLSGMLLFSLPLPIFRRK